MADELGVRARERTAKILREALDWYELDWPRCPCGSSSSFAGVERGTETVLWRCPLCAAAGGWKMTNEGVEFSHESAMTRYAQASSEHNHLEHVMATYDDWTPELQRFSQRAQRGTNEMTDGLLALAAELAALRKSQEPQMLTAVLKTSHSEESLWDGADRDELPPGSKLQHVGWYCAGGHVAPHNAPDFLVPSSLKFEDPCDHAVPVYVLVKS